MHELEIRIKVKTETELSVSEIFQIMQNMKARMEGYHTEVPNTLKNANISIDSKYLVDAIERDLFNEIGNGTQDSKNERSPEISG